MKTIYKYPLELTDVQTVAIPRPADIIHVDYQGDQLCLWAVVDKELNIQINCYHKIHIYGTGCSIENYNSLIHLATVQKNGFVWHIFQEI